MIAAAVTQAEAPIAAAKAPETGAAPKAETEAAPKPSVKAKGRLIRLRRPPSEPIDDDEPQQTPEGRT